MAADANPINESYSSNDLLIPSVDPADLKSIWAMKNEFQILHPGRKVSIGADAYKRACGAKADVSAVILRVTMLESVLYTAEAGHFGFSWIHDGQPEEIVFKIVASIPMVAPQPGTVNEAFPIDVEELIREINKEANV
jgi:hypothetical protein